MKELSTGIQLPRDNGVIRYGDILTSDITYDVIVMYHEDQKAPIVKVMDEDIWFELRTFVHAWGSRLEIERNINYYKS